MSLWLVVVIQRLMAGGSRGSVWILGVGLLDGQRPAATSSDGWIAVPVLLPQVFLV
jgi:hypothetical protein